MIEDIRFFFVQIPIASSTKKLWGDMGDGPKPGEQAKQMFPPGNPWMAPRDDSWGNHGNMGKIAFGRSFMF